MKIKAYCLTEKSTPFTLSIIYSLFFIAWEITSLQSRSTAFNTYKQLLSELIYNPSKQQILLFFTVTGFTIFTIFFIYFIFSSKNILQYLLILLFIFIIIIEYACSSIMMRFSRRVDVVAVFSTPIDQKIDFFTSYLNTKCLIPILVLLTINSIIKAKKVKNYKEKFALFFIMSSVFFYLITIYRGNIFTPFKFYPINSITNFHKTVIDYIVIEAYSNTIIRDTIPKIKPNSTGKLKNIIFIVDESLRSDHMSVYGYNRNTTPFLEELMKNNKIIKFSSCVSGTTASRGSAQLLLTGLRIDELPDTLYKAHKLPTIYQYAKSLGYKTFFLDGQTNMKWLGSYKDYKYIDVWKNKNYFMNQTKKSWNIDIVMANELKSIISSSYGNFIWVWKRGVHFPYSKNYPPNAPTFKSNKNNDKEHLITSYDNGISHNTDNFFRTLYPAVESSNNTVIIYTSDHGESLLDDGKTRLHAGTRKEQAQVPLLILGNTPEGLQLNAKIAHENIFATLLDFMGCPKSYRQYNYAHSLLERNAIFPSKRFYWQNNLTSGKHILFDTY